MKSNVLTIGLVVAAILAVAGSQGKGPLASTMASLGAGQGSRGGSDIACFKNDPNGLGCHPSGGLDGSKGPLGVGPDSGGSVRPIQVVSLGI